MQQRNRSCLIGMIVLLASSALIAQEVQTNYMPGTNFSKFHTYKWVTIRGNQDVNQILDAQIKQAVDSQLAAKGLTKTDADNADLYVDYQTALNQEKQWNAVGTGGDWRLGGGMGTLTSSTINVGTMVLDMYDQAGKQLVWTGRATKTINPSKNQEKNQKNLDKAMAKLLKNFPPKQ
jgi:Domain of unknown function (DUF4136)